MDDLAELADHKTGVIRSTTRSEIAAWLGWSIPKARTLVDELERAGFIVTHFTRGYGGFVVVSRYLKLVRVPDHLVPGIKEGIRAGSAEALARRAERGVPRTETPRNERSLGSVGGAEGVTAPKETCEDNDHVSLSPSGEMLPSEDEILLNDLSPSLPRNLAERPGEKAEAASPAEGEPPLSSTGCGEGEYPGWSPVSGGGVPPAQHREVIPSPTEPEGNSAEWDRCTPEQMDNALALLREAFGPDLDIEPVGS